MYYELMKPRVSIVKSGFCYNNTLIEVYLCILIEITIIIFVAIVILTTVHMHSIDFTCT